MFCILHYSSTKMITNFERIEHYFNISFITCIVLLFVARAQKIVACMEGW